MGLPETFERVLPSVVALASLAIPEGLHLGPSHGIPQVIGTGFVVDPRGIVLTAGHVARSLRALPTNPTTGQHAAAAIVFSEPVRVGDGLELRPSWVDVRGYSFLETFTTASETFYGERIPDLAFVQLGVRDVPALPINHAPNTIRAGLPVAFAGFPLGSDGLVTQNRRSGSDTPSNDAFPQARNHQQCASISMSAASRIHGRCDVARWRERFADLHSRGSAGPGNAVRRSRRRTPSDVCSTGPSPPLGGKDRSLGRDS
jgi:hypothetical protein